MINDSLIAQFIDYRLSNKFNGSVIISGMDASGKSTMATKLASKYRYSKFSYTYEVEYPYNWDDARYIQVFDRCPLIEFYAYDGNMKFTSDQVKVNKELEKMYIKSHLKYFNNPLFVIYLHSLWDCGVQPSSFYKNKDTILNRYLDIVEILNELGLPVIVCTDKGIRQYNILYNKGTNLPDNYFEWR